MADLKAEKVHLKSLANEKAYLDNLKKRLEDMKKTMSEKETEYEESKREDDAMVGIEPYNYQGNLHIL